MSSWGEWALQDTSRPRDLLPRSSRPVVLVVGAASRDLTGDDPKGWRLGGAASYASLTLARLGLRVRALIGVDREAATAPELDLLRSAGVDVEAVPLRHGPVFVNEETAGGRWQRCVEESDVLDVVALPPSWRLADAAVLAPIAAELGPEWTAVPPAGAPIALGWQGLLRTLEPGEPVRRRAPRASTLVARASLVGLSRDDVDVATPLASLEALLDPMATLAITDGPRGGLVGEGGVGGRTRRWRTYRAIEADHVLDPTGAGDVFLAALLAARLDPLRLAGPQGAARGADIRLAAAAASLVVEAPGLEGVATLEEVHRRAARGAPPAPA